MNLFEIMPGRYKNIQDSFQDNIHLINQRFQITL